MVDTPKTPRRTVPGRPQTGFQGIQETPEADALDNESRLGGSPLTGHNSDIIAISPPNQYPQAVWDELVRQGKLKKMGGGMYGLAQ